MTVRNGVTSAAPIIATAADVQSNTTELIGAGGGLYVRLVVKCSEDRKFSATFTAFSDATVYDNVGGHKQCKCRQYFIFQVLILPYLKNYINPQFSFGRDCPTRKLHKNVKA